MFTSEQLKYNVALPGEEFRSRDLSLPSEATKVIYEIDDQHGHDKPLCLTVLAKIFRGVETVTRVLHECGGESSPPWRQQAIINRSVDLAILESQNSILVQRILELERAIMKVRQHAAENELAGPSPVPQNLAGQFRDGQPETPRPSIRRQVEMGGFETDLAKARKEFLDNARRLGEIKADPKNAMFSPEEEAKARRETGGVMAAGPRERGWRECLEQILMAVLKAPSITSTRRQMETLGTNAIDSCFRGSSTELEFATELEKAAKFAKWQANIFLNGAMREEAITRYDIQAFQNFKKGLRMIEAGSWQWIDPEGNELLDRVLHRLRSANSLAPQQGGAVFANPVKRLKTGKQLTPVSSKKTEGKWSEHVEVMGPEREIFEEEEEEAEEEIEAPKRARPAAPPKPTPPPKPTKPIAQVELAQEEEAPIFVALKQQQQLTQQILQQQQRLSQQLNENIPQQRSEQQFTAENQNFSGGNRNQQPNWEGKNFRTNTTSPNRERERRESFSGGGFQGRRGGRGNFFASRENFPERRTRGNNFSLECRFNPCLHPNCRSNHQPGQHKPDPAAFSRQVLFTSHRRCQDFHDNGECTRTGCDRAHGNSARTGARCAQTTTGMCEAFYTQKGCSNSHKRV